MFFCRNLLSRILHCCISDLREQIKELKTKVETLKEKNPTSSAREVEESSNAEKVAHAHSPMPICTNCVFCIYSMSVCSLDPNCKYWRPKKLPLCRVDGYPTLKNLQTTANRLLERANRLHIALLLGSHGNC